MTDLTAGHIEAEPPRRLPLGFGLLAGATASLGLWGGLFWLAWSVI